MAKRRRKRKNEDLALVAIVALFVLSSSIAVNLASQALTSLLVGLTVAALLSLLIAKRIHRNNRYRKAVSLSGIDKMTGSEFEDCLEVLLPSQGFTKVKQTPKSGDFGVDIIAHRSGHSYAIQVKRYKSKLDNTPIQQAVAGMKYYNCDRAMVITNQHFTAPAQVFALGTVCELVDREELGKWLLFSSKGG